MMKFRYRCQYPQLIGHVQLVIDVVEQGNTWFNGVADAPLRAGIDIVNPDHWPLRSDDRLVD
jgi:hypothetical protein